MEVDLHLHELVDEVKMSGLKDRTRNSIFKAKSL